MERSVAPWRVLETETGPVDAGAGPPSRAGGTRDAWWRGWPVLLGLAVAAVLVVVALALVVSGPTPVAIVAADAAPVAAASDGGPAGSQDAEAGETGERIVVHVAGAVRRPGLVELPAGSRVADAIEAAGGLGPRVDAARLGSAINLAAIVTDGERIIVPSRDDTPTAAGSPATGDGGGGGGGMGPGDEPGGPVDLNHATSEALVALPGIGEVTAGRIIEARTERPFASLDELVERKVVGPAALAKFRDLVVVR